MKDLDVFNLKGEVVGKLTPDSSLFDGKVNEALMHQAVVAYLANQRQGTASAKTRGEVSGGGRKPWRQKGTGRARVGSIRSPLWRGGGVTFAPKPRRYHKDLPKKMKIKALKSALNAKLNNDQIIIIDELVLESHKTREFLSIMSNLGMHKEKAKVVVFNPGKNVKLAARNLEKVSIENADSLTTYTALDCRRLVFTKESLEKVGKRLKNG